MTRTRIDVAIVGGGVVGAAAALALAQSGRRVALVEARVPMRWSPAQRDLRVYALSPDNAAFLDTLGVWAQVRKARAQAYRRMQVWDAAGGGTLAFDADALGRTELGWIVEHGLLADALWQALERAGVQVHCPARVQACEQEENSVRLQVETEAGAHRIDARLAMAADGADSSLRSLVGVGVEAREYMQRGVVCFVDCEQPHAETAWQRFLPGGPLALLPFVDDGAPEAAAPGHQGSIVWSLPEEEAAHVLALDDAEFSRRLTDAFAHRLGAMRPTSVRVAFPLRRQLAQTMQQGRVLLVGDAAHVVHPLAGQGVNLGLRDVAALVAVLQTADSHGEGEGLRPRRLARWARERRSETAVAAHAFEQINRLYSNDGMLATFLRGPALGLAGRLPPVVHALWRKAAGL